MTETPNYPADDPRQMIAELQRKLDERTAELNEATSLQTATSEVLQVISSSTGDLQSVFDQLLEKATGVCGAEFGLMGLFDGDMYRRVASYNAPQAFVDSAPRERRPDPDGPIGIVGQTGQVVRIDDLSHSELYLARRPAMVVLVEAAGARTLVVVPMLRDARPIGAISIYRKEVRSFSDRQVELLKNFASQAVIAIENVRLFNETQEALERQKATADILKVIASSPSDVQPVFEAIASSANRLIGGLSTAVYSLIDDMQHLSAFTPINPAADAALQALFPRPLSMQPWPEQTRNGEIVHVPDIEAAPDVPGKWLDVWRMRGFRGFVRVPLRRDRMTVGMITVTRTAPGPFAANQIRLLQTFADQAVIAIRNAELFNETKEALERQTATSDVLNVIASSPTDTQPVFEAIAQRSNRLVNGLSTAVYSIVDDVQQLMSFTPVSPEADAALKAFFPAKLSTFMWGETIRKGKIYRIADTEIEIDDPGIRDMARLRGWRSLVLVPLLRDNKAIGLISITRKEPGSFAAHHVQLLQTFADQAVIAIENTRLFNETKEALERQTATADILKVIASSPDNVQPVFQAIADRSKRLVDALSTTVFGLVDGMLHLRAFTPTTPQADARLQASFPAPLSTFSWGGAISKGEIYRVIDAEQEPERLRGLARERGWRSALLVPLLRDGKPIGMIGPTRAEPGPFTEHHVQLMQTFADQAVIAIQNVELFDKVQARTRDLAESLQQQTATSEVLQVISSSQGDLGPVFHKMLEKATRVCGAEFGAMNLVEGETMRRAALYNAPPEFAAVLVDKTMRIHPQSSILAAISSKRVVQVEDMRQSPSYLARAQHAVELTELGGARTIVVVPMLRDDETIGVITVYRREVRPFSEKQVELLTNFARQAVIAIENSRLITETREALEQQTATADVLKVIGRSAFDLDQVFETVVESSVRLCAADRAIILRFDGEMLRVAKVFNAPQALRDWLEENPIRPGRHSVAARAALERRTIQVEDVRADSEHTYGAKFVEPFRTVLGVPMLKGDDLLGVILVYHNVVRPFTDKQVLLVSTFAEQAAIAIENVRLFDEVQARTRDLQESLQQQTATSEVLKVISSSPGELEPVFHSLLENAVKICDARFGNIFLADGETAHWEAGVGTPPKLAAFFTESTWFRPTPGSHLDRVLRTKQVSHTADDTAETIIGVSARLGGARSTVCVPMVKEDTLVGAIVIYRTEVRPFTDKQIDLVKNFAAQAVIAIENARLLKELRQRTDDLSASLDNLRAAQDRLVQTEKLASLGQLTAGIAHEIKNPLNFVNNFAALSIELTDELNELMKQAALADKLRAEVDELTGLLKENLTKIVQHGTRADSIVKNMLLHSREGSGELRAADINGLVEESLNLAYHGARAEKSGFNITLQREFDASAGEAEVFPQEITRALLNLLSNGFYAATRRKMENGDPDFEPVLSAATKNLDNHVEIRIRDNGTGIPPEVKEKIFNPFFTTKPAGEGTGLGLSMSHDIIVKQHGGRIEVDTQPGQFTEFTIILPRTGNLANNRKS